MKLFSAAFLEYCNYINGNGSDRDYVKKAEKYRDDFLKSLCSATLEELEYFITEYQFLIHIEDGFELYKKYFQMKGKKKEIMSCFMDYLWFWGDYDDEILKLKQIEDEEEKMEKIIKIIICDGLEGLKK